MPIIISDAALPKITMNFSFLHLLQCLTQPTAVQGRPSTAKILCIDLRNGSGRQTSAHHPLQVYRLNRLCAVQMGEDIDMTDAQYGMIEGYAYYLVFGLSMLAWGLIADKYKFNRVYLIVIGSVLTAASLVVQVCSLGPAQSLHDCLCLKCSLQICRIPCTGGGLAVIQQITNLQK